MMEIISPIFCNDYLAIGLNYVLTREEKEVILTEMRILVHQVQEALHPQHAPGAPDHTSVEWHFLGQRRLGQGPPWLGLPARVQRSAKVLDKRGHEQG